MATLALVGTAVMGLLLLVVVLAMARGIDWRSNDIFAEQEAGSVLSTLVHSPVVWVLGFLGVSLGLLGVALLVVGDFGVSMPGGVALAAAPFAALLLAYLIGGTYAAVRERDVSPAGATLASALVVGTLLLVAITAKLALGL